MHDLSRNGLLVGFGVGFFLGATLWVVFYALAFLIGLPFPSFWGMPIGIVVGGLFGMKLQKDQSNEGSD